MQLDLKMIAKEGGFYELQLLTELRAARSALQRIVEKAKEARRLLEEWQKRAAQHPEIREFRGGYQPFLGRATREFLQSTAAIEAGSKVLGRVRD